MFLRRLFVPILLASLLSLLGFDCLGEQISILEPAGKVETFEFDIRFELVGEFQPDTLIVQLNQVDVLAQFEIVEQAVVEGGPGRGRVAPSGLSCENT